MKSDGWGLGGRRQPQQGVCIASLFHVTCSGLSRASPRPSQKGWGTVTSVNEDGGTRQAWGSGVPVASIRDLMGVAGQHPEGPGDLPTVRMCSGVLGSPSPHCSDGREGALPTFSSPQGELKVKEGAGGAQQLWHPLTPPWTLAFLWVLGVSVLPAPSNPNCKRSQTGPGLPW